MNLPACSALHVAFALSVVMVVPTQLAAQVTPDPKSQAAAEMLDQARRLSTIQQPSMPSYRLQASFETFDYKGKADGQGTVLQSFVTGGTLERSVMYRGKHSITYIAGEHARVVADTDFEESFAMQRVIEKLFTPVPDPKKMQSYTYKVQATKFGALELDCVVGSLPYQGAAFVAPGPLHRPDFVQDLQKSAPNAAYCLSRNPVIVRVIEGHNGLVFQFNRILHFGDAYLAGDITMQERGVVRARLHVDGVTGASALKAEDIAVPAESSGGAEPLPPALTAGRKLKGDEPVYPEDAKKRHVQGAVILHGLIGRDGTIRELELISAPDDVLVSSAMDAVRTWKYSPYTVDGRPVEVDTQVTVNYQFR